MVVPLIVDKDVVQAAPLQIDNSARADFWRQAKLRVTLQSSLSMYIILRDNAKK